jgi:Mg2+ and Co2+ transporter CorA
MIKWLYQDEKQSKSGKDLKYAVPDKGVVWIFAVSPTDEELKKISKDFALPLKILKSYSKERRSVRYSFEPFACTFVDYNLSGDKIKRTNVLYFVAKNFIITVLEGPIQSYDFVFSELSENMENVKISSIRALIEILDADIEENYDVLENIENQVAELERELATKRRDWHIERVIELRRTLNRMSRAFWGSSRITYFLRAGLGSLKISQLEARRMEDLHEGFIHQLDIISNHKEILTDIVTIYQVNISNWLATISNKINSSIKLLTWVMFLLTGLTLVITVPNTLATVFGIPYFGLSSSVSGYIVELLIASILIPFVLFFVYWRLIRKRAEGAETQHV